MRQNEGIACYCVTVFTPPRWRRLLFSDVIVMWPHTHYKIVFTSPEAMEFSREKIKPQRSSKTLLTYVNVYSFGRSIWKDLFSFEVNKNLQLQIALNSCCAKNVIRNTDYGARKLCLFPKSWWNSNVVKIIRILFSLFSAKYIAFLYYWSAWFEGIKSTQSNNTMWKARRSLTGLDR